MSGLQLGAVHNDKDYVRSYQLDYFYSCCEIHAVRWDSGTN